MWSVRVLGKLPKEGVGGKTLLPFCPHEPSTPTLDPGTLETQNPHSLNLRLCPSPVATFMLSMGMDGILKCCTGRLQSILSSTLVGL